MRLSDLTAFSPITIQCHDNPDPDAIAPGFGLYSFFMSKGCEVRLVYSGRNTITKSNIQLMINKLHVPITYIFPQKGENFEASGLLITVDCQYGAGNVSGVCSDHVAIIDHHQVEIDSFRGLLAEKNRVLVQLRDKELYSLPICTVEDLLAQAKKVMLQ